MAKNNTVDIFGIDWEEQNFGVRDQKKVKSNTASFTSPDKSDGAVVVDSLDNVANGGGRALAQMSFQADYQNERDLINLYRRMAQEPDVENAIDDIVNEAIVMNSEDDTVEIDLDEVEGISENVKNAISEEFKTILKLMKFRDEGDTLFRQWYVDGRQYHHMIVDTRRPQEGIKEIRNIDPRNIQLVREVQREKVGRIEAIRGFREYYLFSDPRMGAYNQALEISPEAISYVTSGLVDANQRISNEHNLTGVTKDLVISHLHKAIKPFNRLNQLEDALVIYRISRAPERLVFYVDTGNLSKSRGEAYMQENINKYKNKMVYDSVTGKVKNDRHIMSVMENVWLPRKQGSKGTEVSSLSGAMNLGNIDDVQFFKTRMLESLKTPASRFQEGSAFSSRETEISRDELKFTKFSSKQTNRYSKTFLILLKTQCILKRICKAKEWDEWRDDIKFIWAEDSYFNELKEQEIWSARFETLQAAGIENPIGKYLSHEWARKTILRQSSDDIKEEDKLIKKEQSDKILNPPDEDEFGVGDIGGDQPPKTPDTKPNE